MVVVIMLLSKRKPPEDVKRLLDTFGPSVVSTLPLGPLVLAVVAGLLAVAKVTLVRSSTVGRATRLGDGSPHWPGHDPSKIRYCAIASSAIA